MEWLTVAQASQKYSLSQSAVKRLIYKLEKEKPTLVKKQGRLNFISAAAFVHPNDSERSPNVHRTNDSEQKEYDKIIDILKNELSEKNEQIRLLQVDAEQKNKLLAHLQTQLQIGTPANDTERSPNVHRTNNANDTERKAVLFNTVLLICILIILILLFVNIV